VHKYWLILLSCFLALAILPACYGQHHRNVPVLLVPPPPAQVGSYGGQFPSAQQQPPADPAEIEAERKRENQANKDRQASLKKDTDQLFKLANELKTSVDKTTEYTLSLEVIKKAEEIERLAKNVKDKMKSSGYGPSIGDPANRR